jgi:hypothetical protein
VPRLSSFLHAAPKRIDRLGGGVGGGRIGSEEEGAGIITDGGGGGVGEGAENDRNGSFFATAQGRDATAKILSRGGLSVKCKCSQVKSSQVKKDAAVSYSATL